MKMVTSYLVITSGNHMKFNASTGNLDVVGTITIGASSPAVPLPEGVVSSSAQIEHPILVVLLFYLMG